MAQAHPQARRYDSYQLRVFTPAGGEAFVASEPATRDRLAVGVLGVSLWRRRFE